MYKKALYRSAYRLLNESTPLKYDCGILCGSKCCSGDSENGMLLFPGEEVMFDEAPDFLDIRKEKLGASEVSFAVCIGSCHRKLRPLSCRIFPLIPYIGEDRRLTVIEDPRARYLCPLMMGLDQIKIDRVFYRNVLKTFHLLIKDAEIRKCVEELSGAIEEYSRFTGTSTD